MDVRKKSTSLPPLRVTKEKMADLAPWAVLALSEAQARMAWLDLMAELALTDNLDHL
jgi:hypothetical protein